MDMKFTVNYTFTDIYEAYKLAHKSSKTKWIILLSGLFLALTRIFVLSINKTIGIEDLFWGFLAIIFLFYPYTLLRIQAFFMYRKAKNFQKTNYFEFNDKGMRIKNEFETGEVGWKGFSKFIVNDKILLLYRTPHFVNFIPKRSIRPDNAWFDLLELVVSKIEK